MQDPYEVLGTPADAGLDEIEKRYAELSLEYDTDPTTNVHAELQMRSQILRIKQAYDVIRGEDKKAANEAQIASSSKRLKRAPEEEREDFIAFALRFYDESEQLPNR